MRASRISRRSPAARFHPDTPSRSTLSSTTWASSFTTCPATHEMMKLSSIRQVNMHDRAARWAGIVVMVLVSTVLARAFVAQPATGQTEPFLNPDLPIDERVDDLVARMTLEEKVSQLLDQAPAIERLGIHEYNWWNEALHGVARSGIATVFPQAIGLAATWNDTLIHRMANVISDEARAKHHNYARRGQYLRYQGLTIFSPNINIFRDPRWGRGQETYGEDPFLTAKIAEAFVKGLQGDDPHYLK